MSRGRWLAYFIAVLPFAASVITWVRSYRVFDEFQRGSEHILLLINVHRGALGFTFMTNDGWRLPVGDWNYSGSESGTQVEHFTEHRMLGFGYESAPWPGISTQVTIIEIPVWSLTVLTALPPVLVYRHQRKRRKTGFPVEPLAVSSTK